MPEEGPEGQPGGVEDALPARPLLLEDLLDHGLGKDAVETEFGPGDSAMPELEELEAEPGRGRLSHAEPPCG